MVEKPKEFVSDLAMIGIYYFKEAEKLRTELQYLIDNNIIKGGEYQLPDALRRLTEKGVYGYLIKPKTIKKTTMITGMNQALLVIDPWQEYLTALYRGCCRGEHVRQISNSPL